MLKKKTEDTGKTLSSNLPWAKKVQKPRHDRIINYLEDQDKLSPQRLFQSIKRYWIIAVAFNVLTLGLLGSSMWDTISKNLSNPVKLVRVDGKIVEESLDERRSILVENVIQRVQIKQQQTQDNAPPTETNAPPEQETKK